MRKTNAASVSMTSNVMLKAGKFMPKAGCIGLALSMFVLGAPAHATDLDSALRAALVNSADLAAARQNWLAARENIGTSVASSEWRGTGTVTGTHATNKTATRRTYKQNQTGSASIAFSSNIYDGGQTKENRKAGLLTLESVEASYEASEQRLILSTVEAYLAIVKATKDISLNQSNVARLADHVNAARVRLAAGAATPTRLAEAEARYARAKTTLIAAETALANAQDSFQTVTALPPENLQQVAALTGLPGDLLSAEKIGLSMHPDIRAAKAAERAAEQGYDTLLASVRPTVSLRFSATDTQASGKAQDKTEFAARLQLSTPLMVSNATKAKSRNVSAKIAAAKYSRDAALRDVGLNIRKAFRALETAEAQIAAVVAELDASRLVAQGIANEVEFGQKTTLDLQDAEQSVTDAELRMVSAEHSVLLASYRLQAAIGRLTTKEMGLEDVLGDLDNIPQPELRASSIMSLLDND